MRPLSGSCRETKVELDLQPLIDRFYDYFLNLYHHQSDPSGTQADIAKAGQPFLAFGNIGTPLTPDMFQLQDGSPSVDLVREQFSALANQIPELDGTTILTDGLLTADGAYGALLAQAQPLTAADLTALGAIKGPADAAFDQASDLPMIHGGAEYRPALPVPPDWPLPGGDSAWSSYSFTTEQKTSVTPPPGTTPPIIPRPSTPWRWRVAPPELLRSATSVATVATTIKPVAAPAPSPAAQAHLAILRTPFVLNTAAKTAVSTRPVALAAAVHPAAALRASAVVADRGELLVRQATPAPTTQPVQLQVVRSQVLQAQLQAVRAQSQPEAVTASSIEISFRYCMVPARRSWLSMPFLTARNWYIPRMHAGEIASGTGTGGGTFEVIPVAALCVRDLTIKASWSNEERAVLPALTKFGPFSLIGSKLDAASTSLECNGTQIIGWIMEPMPLLPPNSDPSLPAASSG
jgi:hypothetical protein